MPQALQLTQTNPYTATINPTKIMTWAELKAMSLAGTTPFVDRFFVTDVGANGSEWYWNGLRLARVQKKNGVKVAILGDSITWQNYTSNKNSALGYIHWARALSKQRFISDVSLSFGVAGYTTSDVIANTLALCVNSNPDYAVVLIGTNDISGSFTYETITANLTTIYNTLISSGIKVIAIPILPRTYIASGGAISDAILNKISRVNQWICDTVAKTENMYLCDPCPLLGVQSTGLSIGGGVLGSAPATNSTTVTYDGLHPSPNGAYLIGLELSKLFNQLLPEKDILGWSAKNTYDATNNPNGNLMSNGMITTTSGGTLGTAATGTVAGSWTIRRQSGSSFAPACSIVSKTQNGISYNAQRIVLSAGTTSDAIQMYQQKYLTGLIGKKVVAECAVSVSGITGTASIKGIYIEASDGTNTSQDLMYTTSGYAFPDSSFDAVMATPPLTMTANVQQFSLWIRIDGTIASAGVTVDISRINLRVID